MCRLVGLVALVAVATVWTGCPSSENDRPGDDVAVTDTGPDSGPDAAPDDDVAPDAQGWGFAVPPGERVEGFGENGPMYAGDGCVYWDPDDAPVTTTAGGTMVDGDGNPVEFEAGATVTPFGMCTTYTAETQVIRQSSGTPPAPPGHPRCTPTDTTGCPLPAGAPKLPPAYAPGAPEPPPPIAYVPPTEIVASCTNGTGFSFESGTITGWTGFGDAAKEPVFGNNVSIKRLRPPGFYPAGTTSVTDYIIEREIGGDYWEFSRDVNQGGNWWYGSADVRPSHTLRPGGRRSERAVGFIESGQFKIEAPYLAFWLGGTSDVAQRVELQVLAANVNEAGLVALTHQGIGAGEYPPNWDRLNVRPNPLDSWVVVRSASALDDGDYMGRRVVWNIDEYAGMTARLRVIDEERDPAMTSICMLTNCVWVDKQAHINVDDFRCLDAEPEGAVPLDSGQPVDFVSQVIKPQPLWGFTESHSHATANLAFGGHMIWGDAGDELYDVYNCLHDLNPIVDRTGNVLRPAINDPRRATSCTVRPEIVAGITSTIQGVCLAASAVIIAIPIVGPILAAAEIAACSVFVSVATVVLSTPLITGHYYHGAQMPTSGAVVPGPMLQVVQAFLVGLGVLNEADTIGRIHGMIELKDPDQPDGSHSGQGLGQFHNHYQKDMIRRAFKGGLRLMVIDVHNSRAMQSVLDGAADYDDWRATRDHIRAVRRLVAPAGDPEWPTGPLNDIAAIASTPAQARSIITSGRVAIVLGAEVMEFGKKRTPADTIEAQVADLYAMGVRKITAIHGTNNPLGGTALFQDVYQSANVFNNLTVDGDGNDVAVWEDLIPPVTLSLPSDFPYPFNEMSLGSWGIMSSMVAPPCVGPCRWNLANKGYFELTDNPDPAGVVGDVADVDWRLGLPSIAAMQEFGSVEEVDSKHLTINRAYSLAWLLGSGPGGFIPVGCSFEGMYLPLEGVPPDDVESVYDDHASHGHFNARGLSGDGEQFLRHMMRRGMLVDTDHFSQVGRVDTFRLTRLFANEAGHPNTDYPVFGVHTELRGSEFGGPYPDIRAFRDAGGAESEISKTEAEIERIAAAGGTITMSVPGFLHDAPYAAGVVDNNCDFSSKGYAHKYLKAMELTGGRGLTPGFDMNGFAPHIASRYGIGNACRTGITAKALEIGGYEASDVASFASWASNPPLASWPRDWMRPTNDCRYNGSLREAWNPDCPSTRMLNGQREEFSGVIYNDYAGRTRGPADWLLAGLPADHEVVLARAASDARDDGALRAAVDEWVYIGGGGPEFRQSRPIIKWRNDGVAASAARNTGWDYNLDGLRHIGLMPDLMQDLHNVGVTWELMTPMFNSAEDYIRMWEINCDLARDWTSADGGDPTTVCAP